MFVCSAGGRLANRRSASLSSSSKYVWSASSYSPWTLGLPVSKSVLTRSIVPLPIAVSGCVPRARLSEAGAEQPLRLGTGRLEAQRSEGTKFWQHPIEQAHEAREEPGFSVLRAELLFVLLPCIPINKGIHLIVPEVLNHRPAVRVRTRVLKLLARRARIAALEQRPDSRTPQRVDVRLVREDRVRRGRERHGDRERDEDQYSETCHT
jgi:hypothetical protein